MNVHLFCRLYSINFYVLESFQRSFFGNKIFGKEVLKYGFEINLHVGISLRISV